MIEPLGTLEGDTHVFRVRIYYEDTDVGGVVYYANYLRYAERARTDFLAVLGVAQTRLLAERGVLFVVRECNVRYLQSAHLDDQLEVRTRVERVAGAAIDLSHDFVRDDGTPLNAMTVRVATVRDGRPVRLPDDIRASFENLISSRNR